MVLARQTSNDLHRKPQMKTPEAIAREELLARYRKENWIDQIFCASISSDKLFIRRRLRRFILTAFLDGLEAGKRIERAAQEKGEK